MSHLERLLQSYGRATGVAPNRLRRWLTMMVMIGALDPSLTPCSASSAARPSRSARRRRSASTSRSRSTVARGRPCDLEISPPEGRAGDESQILDAISIEDFGLIGPETVRCLSIRYQIAQKLHACTEAFPISRENDRFRDLVDLLLLRALDPDLTAIRHACVDIFASRATHSWPPALRAPSIWAEPYARLAGDLEFAIPDLDEAATLVGAFIAEIDEAVDITPPPPRPGQTWRRDDGVRVKIQNADSTR